MREHPSWCVRSEPHDQEEHVSATMRVAEPDDLIGIRLRKTQPDGAAALAMIEVEFIDCDQLTAYPLSLRQARTLANTVSQLLRSSG